MNSKKEKILKPNKTKNGLMFALLFFNLKITQYQNFCEYHSMKKHWHDYLF